MEANTANEISSSATPCDSPLRNQAIAHDRKYQSNSPCDARDIAADHQYHAEFAKRVSKLRPPR